jgi:hypothetical protein
VEDAPEIAIHNEIWMPIEANRANESAPSRSSQPSAIGAVFVTADGLRHLIPDHWLAQAELAGLGRLLRLLYSCCTIEVAGRQLEPLFQDALVGWLGMILEGPAVSMPGDQLWANIILVIARADAVPAFERE